uniref:NADH dehydrogenase subunit 4L n=1 Tax=Panagrellus redivivus TaxID=6233 RepID=A0A7E4ZQL9_PANRE
MESVSVVVSYLWSHGICIGGCIVFVESWNLYRLWYRICGVMESVSVVVSYYYGVMESLSVVVSYLWSHGIFIGCGIVLFGVMESL